MAGRQKAIRKLALKDINNVTIQPDWIEGNLDVLESKIKEYPKLILEIGCGKGEYCHALAQANPNTLFIGIDMRGQRIWQAQYIAESLELKNTHWISTKAEHLLQPIITNQVDEIWITFPGPFPKNTHKHRRLTAPHYTDIFHKLLKPNGLLHLKTDHVGLFEYSQHLTESPLFTTVYIVKDIYHAPAQSLPNSVTTIKTAFENKFLAQNKPINYLQVQKNQLPTTHIPSDPKT